MLDEGAAELAVQALGTAESPHDRMHAMHCLLNFTRGGVGQLRAAGAVEAARQWAEPAAEEHGGQSQVLYTPPDTPTSGGRESGNLSRRGSGSVKRAARGSISQW